MLIQYARWANSSTSFSSARKSIKIVIAPAKPEELWKKIKTLRKQITSGESGAASHKEPYQPLRSLDRADRSRSWKPIKGWPFIPNQLLFYLPHAVPGEEAARWFMVRYLIEDKQIVYLTAADVMKVVQPPDEDKSRDGMVALWQSPPAQISRRRKAK